MSADEVYEYADVMLEELEAAQGSVMTVANQIKPLIAKAKERRITEDDLFNIAQDVEELAELLRETAEDMEGPAKEFDRRHFGVDEDEETGGGSSFLF